MKTVNLTIILALPVLLISCGEDQPAPPEQAELAGSPAPATAAPLDSNSEPAPPANAPPAPPVNIAKLNRDLVSAISFNQADKALEAISAGATPEAKSRYGLPVIFMAAQSGDSAVVKALIEAGADPNAKIGTSFNDDGVGYAGTTDGTVLGYAAAKGHGLVMKDLVAVGADVNGSGPEGTTPLMQAAEAGDYEIVKWLIDAGADPNAKNKHGGTALSYIQTVVNPDEGRRKIISLLQAKSR